MAPLLKKIKELSAMVIHCHQRGQNFFIVRTKLLHSCNKGSYSNGLEEVETIRAFQDLTGDKVCNDFTAMFLYSVIRFNLEFIFVFPT